MQVRGLRGDKHRRVVRVILHAVAFTPFTSSTSTTSIVTRRITLVINHKLQAHGSTSPPGPVPCGAVDLEHVAIGGCRDTYSGSYPYWLRELPHIHTDSQVISRSSRELKKIFEEFKNIFEKRNGESGQRLRSQRVRIFVKRQANATNEQTSSAHPE